MLNGVINVYKEAGFTSHDVVAKLRGICGQKKIGHTGTLDPAATGVLPVCLGNGTGLCDMLADRDKEYIAEMLFGVRTDTQDATGKVICRKEVDCTEEEAKEAILSFQGEYLQTPPMYSALKVNGKRLYELARAGKEVERKKRPVTIHEIEILWLRLPRASVRVRCSKGTYIRTLCDDIGARLCCGAVMTFLERTRVGEFGLQDALTLDRIQNLRDQGRLEECIRPVEQCFAQYDAVHVLDGRVKLVENGNSFYPSDTVEKICRPAGGKCRVLSESGRFYGIYAYEGATGRYLPVKMFL